MMPIRFLILKQWRRRPLRIVITIVSVVIAVATLLGSTMARQLVRDAQRRLQDSLQGTPALEIVAAAGGRFDPGEAQPAANDPRVSRFTPLAFRTSVIRAQGKKATVLMLGVDFKKLDDHRPEHLLSGTWPETDDQLLLDDAYARRWKIAVGERVTLLGKRGPHPKTVVGILSGAGMKEIRSGAGVVMSLKALQDMFGLGNVVDRVRLDFGDETERVEHADLPAIIETWQAKLPAGLQLRKPEALVVYQEEMLRAMELALNFATALSCVMAMFLVFNTLRMNFFERRRELAIVRAIGAAGSQIRRLLLAEALLIGVGGALLGIPAGWGLAKGLQVALARMMETTLAEPRPTIVAILSAMALGIIVVLAGALWTIREARDISPVEAMRDQEPAVGERYPWKMVALAILGWSAAVVCFVALRNDRAPAWIAIPAGILMLTSFLAFIPAILPALIRLTARFVFAPFPVFALLAVEQLNRRRVRTGLTVGVLVVAVSSGVGLGNAINNHIDDVYTWHRKAMFGEFFLFAIEGTSSEDRLRELETALDAIPEIASRTAIRYQSCKLGELSIRCMIRDLPADQPLPWNIPHANEQTLRDELDRGKIVVGSVLAQRAGIGVGDTIVLEIEARLHSFSVAAIVQDYLAGGLSVGMTTETARQNITLGLPFAIALKTHTQPTPQTSRRISALAEEFGWGVQSWVELSAGLSKSLDGLIAALWSLIAVGFIVGGLGIMNTLTMNILEQTREIGLLRVLGMSQRQTLLLVFAQVALIVAMGLLLGTAAGLTTAFLIDWVSVPLLGREVPFQIRTNLIWINSAFCLVIALISTVIPAYRAVRVRMMTAVSYE